MSKLFDTFSWAMTQDITQLRKAVKVAGLSPLLAIGSGGSLSAAHSLAKLHQHFTGHLAAVATPLEAMTDLLTSGTATWLISAGGGNVDIVAAFRALVEREPRQLAVLCGKSMSPLAEDARKHRYTDLLLYEPPTGKDGFLATNSLLAFVTLLVRAYAEEFQESPSNIDAQAKSVQRLLNDAQHWERLRIAAAPIWARNTILVLHGSATKIGAIDLESKFTEAAVGNLQIADYRNFAHGRHHWLSKRGTDSAVLALISESDRALAERTLDLIPVEIPQTRLFIDGPPESVIIGSLVAALRLTGWAGEARGIDPGRPGVPEFGRKLYHLPLPKERSPSAPPLIGDDDVVAIERKAGLSLARLTSRGELDRWRADLLTFRERLSRAIFAGIVLDYDGTIVDTRERFSPPEDEMTNELVRLVRGGVRLAIATGRGASVKRDLRTRLPADLWGRVLIGYYNGAEVATLADDQQPTGDAIVCDELAPLADALRAQSELSEIAEQVDRRYQITLQARMPIPESRLWDLAQQTVLLSGQRDVVITRSSHSVDIVASGVSKLRVIAHLRESVADSPILTIGDRGRWPGNDFELLRGSLSLGVDELSVDPNTCWNLAPRGQRGVAATLLYLKSLQYDADGALRFRGNAL